MNDRYTTDGAGAEDADDLPLSRSEAFAHNSAMRVSGGTRAGAEMKTQRALASIVLGFELIVVFLIGMTVFGLGILTPPELGIWGGIGLCALIIVALGLMRFGRVGIGIGWAVHVLMLASGIVLPMALIVGVIFTALWVYCMVKGARIDRDRERFIREQSQGD
jgi:hypothetical protein